ncbi:MAG: phytanoyl-CoA dioxygenase family protein [Pseudomonadota bacterium]
MAELRRHDSSCHDDIAESLRNDGACIAHGFASRALCDAVLEDLAPALADQAWGVDDLGYRADFYGNRTKRLHGLFRHSTRLLPILLHPLMMHLSTTWFVASGMARSVRLSNAELMVLGEGQTNQKMHTDAASWPAIQSLEEREILLSVNLALTEFTAENGATRVVPGSHRRSYPRDALEADATLAVMPKGSALIYTGNAWHSGGENRTPTPRVGLYLGFIPSTLRPLENHLLTNGRDSIAALPSEAQVLLDVSPGGFTVYA